MRRCRTRWTLVVVAVLAMGMACKCGSSGTPVDTSVFPKDVIFVAGLTPRALTKTPLFEKLGGPIKDSTELREFRDSCGIDPLRDIRVLAFAGRSVEAQSEWFVLVSGSFDRARLESCVEKLEGVKPETEGKLSAYTLGLLNRKVYAHWLAKDTVLLSEDKATMLAVVEGKSSVKDNPELADLLARTDTAANLWAAGSVPDKVSEMVGFMGTGVAPRAGYLSVRYDGDLEAVVGLRYKDKAEAEAQVRVFNQQLEEMKALPGMSDFVGDSSYQARDRDVTTRMSLDEDQIEQLTSMAAMMGPME